MIKILIVEDQTLLRDALANVINGQEDMQVVGFTANADEALDLCRKTASDLALIDVVTQDKANGIAAAAEIRRELPAVKIVIMTALPEITFVDAARKAGAHSFIYKDAGSSHLLYVIRSTMEGHGVYPGPGDKSFAKDRFTDAEIALIHYVCMGKSRKELAEALAVPEGSVKELIAGILGKTGFDNIMQFSVYAVAHGLIIPDHGLPVPQKGDAVKHAPSTITDSDECDDLLDLPDTSAPPHDVDMSAFYAFKKNIEKLSRAETAVFAMYIEGYSVDDIAKKLSVSINTIKSHSKNIYSKLHITSRKEMMIYARMMNISNAL